MAWRLLRTWVGGGALLVLLLLAAAPAASGAAFSWEFEAETYEFGPQLAGGAPTEHAFVLTNTGEEKIERILWGVRWYLGPEGTSPLDEHLFRLGTAPVCRTLAPGESCTMVVAFAPESVGQKYGELQVHTSHEGPPAIGVQLRGQGASPRAQLAPEGLSFGSVEVGKSSAPQSLSVENVGDYGLRIESIYLADILGAPQPSSPFQVVGGSCQAGLVVAPGAGCTIEVVLAPSAIGPVGARLAIADDAPGSPQSVEVQGAGVAAAQSAGPPAAGAVPTSKPPPIKPKPAVLVCPKTKRRAVKHGKQICVRKRHHRHHAHPGRH